MTFTEEQTELLKRILRLLIRKEIERLGQQEEATTSAAVPGYQTPFAFSDTEDEDEDKDEEFLKKYLGSKVAGDYEFVERS